ncbi:UNVERIFIED_CONTAM: hypothetical protein GTU68_063312, partial [Idotea baltica]|nr:hypothetical protein [Idotea baltica]
GKQQPVAVVLVNLGTPEAPTPKAVKRFLGEFLSDKRVVEIPRIVWLIILNLFVLPLRPKRVAEAYKLIWTDRGSPIRWITEDQVAGLQSALADRYADRTITVTHAMTYGKPSIAETLDQLYQTDHRRIVVLPIHCECTTGAVVEKLGLTEQDYTLAYQSRFGKAEWVKPYADKTIEKLASEKVKTLDVVCPAFSADCLETLEEIAEQNAELFVEAGG